MSKEYTQLQRQNVTHWIRSQPEVSHYLTWFVICNVEIVRYQVSPVVNMHALGQEKVGTGQ